MITYFGDALDLIHQTTSMFLYGHKQNPRFKSMKKKSKLKNRADRKEACRLLQQINEFVDWDKPWSIDTERYFPGGVRQKHLEDLEYRVGALKNFPGGLEIKVKKGGLETEGYVHANICYHPDRLIK